MADVHTRALTASHPITPTSRRCLSAWQPNPGRGSTYRSGKTVHTTGSSSLLAACNVVSTRLSPGEPSGSTVLIMGVAFQNTLRELICDGVEQRRRLIENEQVRSFDWYL